MFNIILSCITCKMTCTIYLPVFLDLLATLYFRDIAENKAHGLLFVTVSFLKAGVR